MLWLVWGGRVNLRRMAGTLLLAGALAGAAPGAGLAAWEAGAGMEYFTLNLKLDASDRLQYIALLQSTLTHVRCEWSASGLTLALSGGLSDWNVSGEWRLPGVSPISIEPFFWAWQQKIVAEARYEVYAGLAGGLRYRDHDLQHYDGRSQYVFMDYRERAMEFLVSYQVPVLAGLSLRLEAAYAPWCELELFQSFADPYYGLEFYRFQADGRGTRWQGMLAFRYRDSAGWGLTLDYALGRSAFATTPAVTVTTGSIAGALILMF
jgi:hypothetical protein